MFLPKCKRGEKKVGGEMENERTESMRVISLLKTGGKNRWGERRKPVKRRHKDLIHPEKKGDWGRTILVYL